MRRRRVPWTPPMVALAPRPPSPLLPSPPRPAPRPRSALRPRPLRTGPGPPPRSGRAATAPRPSRTSGPPPCLQSRPRSSPPRPPPPRSSHQPTLVIRNGYILIYMLIYSHKPIIMILCRFYFYCFYVFSIFIYLILSSLFQIYPQNVPFSPLFLLSHFLVPSSPACVEYIPLSAGYYQDLHGGPGVRPL